MSKKLKFLLRSIFFNMQNFFRKKRARTILKHFPHVQNFRIIDVGGSLRYWHGVNSILRPKRIVIFNLSISSIKLDISEVNHIEMHSFDGERIPLEDQSADIVFCNSVFEHVTPNKRTALALEIQRIGKAFVIQTPSPIFPLELHFGLPFIHWLPRKVARHLACFGPIPYFLNFDGKKFFDKTRLLDKDELQILFPNSQIVVEKFFGIPKSYLAIDNRMTIN